MNEDQIPVSFKLEQVDPISFRLQQVERVALTFQEFADAFGISLQTVHARVKEGTIRSFKIGSKTRRIPASELHRLMNEVASAEQAS